MGAGAVSAIGPPAPKPCQSCPYRRDVPSGVWSTQEYAKLPTYDGETWEQNVRLFQCHQNGADSERARLCGGWVGCHGGEELLALRMAVAGNKMTIEDAQAAMRYSTSVPLFTSGAEAAAHGVRDLENPSMEAMDLIDKIEGQRSDVTYE